MARKSRKAANCPAEPRTAEMRVWQAALYIRLSVEFNSKRGDSLETQRQIMEAYLALRPDIEVAGVYTDNGATGQNFERAAFQRLLTDIESGKIDCVIVKDLSRLGRNVVDTGFYLEKYFPVHGVRFIAVNDQYDSENADNTGSHITVPLKNMINEAVALDISRKVRSQQRHSMMNGEYVGARPPYGYLKDPENCHALVVNAETAPIVRQIFQWTVEGVSMTAIARRLNEEKVLTPGCYLASIGLVSNAKLIGSGEWKSCSVARILADPVYTGDLVQGKSHSVRRKQEPAKPEDWIVVRDTHEAIISRELFSTVQDIRKAAAEKYTSQSAIPYSENILRGKIFCGCCGRHLNRRRENGRTYVYFCIANDRVARGSCPVNTRISQNTLFQTILVIIRKEAELVMGDALYWKQADSKVAQRKEAVEREITQLRKTTQRNRAFMTGLYESFVTGVLTEKEYHEMKAGYEDAIESAERTVRKLLKEQSELERQVKRCVSVAEKLAALDADSPLTRMLVDDLIERIVVTGKNDIAIDFAFKSGFEQLREVVENG